MAFSQRRLHTKNILPVKLLYVWEKYCPETSYQPQFDGLQPTLDLSLPPCIYHIKPDRKWLSVVDCIVSEGKIPVDYAKLLIYYGAIYFAKNANSHKNKKPTRLLQDQVCDESSYIRVHVNPRRFVSANSITWSDRFISLSTINFIVVNKPNAVPSLSTVDNALENVQMQVEKACHQRLLSLGRLDTCTSGLLVFATTKASAAYFHSLIRDRMIDKRYLVLTNSRPRVGVLKHWFPQADLEHAGGGDSSKSRHKNAKPGLLAVYNNELENDELVQGRYCIAEMNLLSVREVTVTTTEEEVQQQTLFESEVQLITGRTHQIRLQFSAEGWPVIGDSRYEAVAGQTTRLLVDEDDQHDSDVKFGPEPKKIGLHCCELVLPLLSSSCGEVAVEEMEVEQHGIQSSYNRQTNQWRLRCPSPWWR